MNNNTKSAKGTPAQQGAQRDAADAARYRSPRWARHTARGVLALFTALQLQAGVGPGGQWSIGVAPAHAQVPPQAAFNGVPIADPRAPLAFQPGVQMLQGGAALVNITTPNAAGVSLNQFQRFDVPSSGVVLNNSLVGGTPLLGGQAAANPNLAAGRTANTIVNEVTVAGPAGRIGGTVEVFGNPASVIIANPNGITCDGCGVVNTPHFTLSTGAVQWRDANGAPSAFAQAVQPRFSVAGGQIDVLGIGIEGTVGQLDLIGETLFIDGPLRAHYLNRGISSIQLTAGRQSDADAGKNAATALAASATALGQRGIAIDATALGAMTAGQIRVISTDAGMGVNLRGAVLAYQEDVAVRSAGNLQAAGVSAARNIQLDSSGRITVAGEVTAHQLQANGAAGAQFDGPVRVQGNVQLQSSAGDVAITDKLLVGGNLDARAAGALQLGGGQSVIDVAGTATIKGQDIRQDGRLSVARDLTIDGERSAGLYGTTLVGNHLDLRARDSATLAGRLQVNESADIAADSVSASGQTAISRNLTIAGGRSIEMAGATQVGQVLNMDAARIGLLGDVNAGAMNVTGGEVQLGQPGAGLNIAGNLNLNVRGPMNAQGAVRVGGSAALVSGSDIGFGDTVSIGGNLSLRSGAGVAFGSTVSVGGNAHIAAGGGISAASDIAAGGGIGASAGGDIRLSGASVSGAGQQWSAGGDFTAGAGLTGGGIGIDAGNVTIAGDVAGGAVGITARDRMRLGGNVRSAGSVELNAGAGGISVNAVQANENIAIRSQGSIDLQQASARGDLDIASRQGDLVLDGPLTSGRNLSVAAQGRAVLKGDVQSGGNVQISGFGVSLARGVQAQGAVRLDAAAGGVSSLADVVANGDVRIASGGGIDVRGAVASGGTLELDSAQKIAVTGDLTAGGGLAIQTASELQAQNLRAGGNLRVVAPSARLRSVQATGNAVVQTQDDLRIDGDFVGGSIAATSARGDIGVGGNIATPGALTLSAGRSITATDVIGGAAAGANGNAATAVQAGGDLHLRSLQAGGRYDATVGGDHRIDQTLTVQGAASVVSGGDLRIGGSASFGGSLDARAGGQVAIQGDTLVLQDARVQSGTGQGYGGTVRVAGRLEALAGQGIAVAQELRVNQGVALQANAGAIDIGGPLATLGDLRLTGQQGVRVAGDAEFARGDVASAAGAIQFGGSVQAGAPLTLQAQGDISITGPLVAQAALAAESRAGSIGFGGKLDVAGNADLHAAQNLVFSGNSQWLGQANLRADSGRIHNQAQMTFAQPVSIDTTGDLVNDGLMQSQGNIAIRARSIDSNRAAAGGIVTGGQLTLQSSAGMALGAQGSWSAAQGMDVQAAAGLGTAGILQAGGNITYGGGTLANAGRIVADGIGVNAALNNGGDILAQQRLDVSGATTNFGQIAANIIAMGALSNAGQVSGSAVSLGSTSNTGGISGTVVDVSGGLDNGGSVSALGTLSANGGSVTNTGTLNGGTVLLNAGAMSNGGRIHADGLMSITGSSFDNGLAESRTCVIANGCAPNGPASDWRYVQSPGTVDAGAKLTVQVASLSNKGVVSSGGDVEITGSLSNVRSVNDPLTSSGVSGGGASTGIISAAGNLTVTGASVQNSGGQLSANGAVTIRSSGAFTNTAPAQGVSGQVSGSQLTIDAASVTNQGQLISRNGDLAVTATAGGIDNNGTLAAAGDVTLKATAAVSGGADSQVLGKNITVTGASFSNAGTLYGQGGPAAKIDIQTGGGFSNAASGVIIAGSLLDIGASSYANSGVVGSLADAKLTTPGSYAAASNALIALGKLDLQVNGIQVGVGESWSVGAAEVRWGGTLLNEGSVAIAGSASGAIHNRATGQVQATGMPNVFDGTYEIPTAPAGLTDAKVVGYSNVANRAQLYIGGGFNGSLINEASDATVGGGTIEQRPIDQKVIWEGKDANGDTVQVEGDSRAIARLNTGSGAATITLTGPNTGTIVGDAITINGGTIVHQPGIDPATGLHLVQEARSRQVQTTAIAQAPEGQTVQGNIKGPTFVGVARPDTLPAPVGGGSGASNAGAGPATAGTGGPGVPSEVPPQFIDTKPLALPRVDVSTPQGGLGALLGGGLSVSLPDWSQLHIVPGGISANDLALNLSGQFVNRGQFEVTNNLIIAAAGGIDNFGAGIRAGGLMRLSGGGLNNEQGRIEADSLLTSIQGDIANSRGAIVA
ncbi:filamentous hemagglutinin N-terminal domain-containing protein, partial [Paracidovorax valerianellae]|uniref:filamentous hemagglutinin N-terminal domain-containing protein n=1 Tax=Paracidovorax valerianellae TaxID=187868 RepID=UPI002302278D